jgi:hypothetical protein
MDPSSLGNSGGGIAPLGTRDAFHAPAVAAFSDTELWPGARVVFVNDDCSTVRESTGDDWQAIVDPFLSGRIEPHTKFWVLMRPSLVTKVFHQFEIPGKPSVEEMIRRQEQQAISVNDDDDSCSGCW